MNVELSKEDLLRIDEALTRFSNTYGTDELTDSLLDRINARAHGHWPDTSGEIWYCESHKRQATWMFQNPDADPKLNPPQHQCDPKLGGILLPCRCKKLDNPLITKDGVAPSEQP